LLVEAQFIEQADRLLRHAGGERGHTQRAVARRLLPREQRARRRHLPVEIVEDAGAIDQRGAVIQHQRRHAQQRVVGPDLLEIAEHRPGLVLKRQFVQPQRDADAPHER
jgi:hypothetical protein